MSLVLNSDISVFLFHKIDPAAKIIFTLRQGVLNNYKGEGGYSLGTSFKGLMM